MKAFKFFAMLIAAATLSFTTTSCDNDDLPGDIDNAKITTDLKKSSNEIVLTVKAPKVYTETHTAKFNEKKECTSMIVKVVYETTKMADIAWEETKAEGNEDGVKWKKDGKTITCDQTAQFQGTPYDRVLHYFEMIKAGFENNNDAQ